MEDKEAIKETSQEDKDMFDCIVMAEERFHVEGYDEGFSAGQIVAEEEGLKIGQQKGREIGWEFGFYLGFVTMWLQLLKKDASIAKPKVTRALEALQTMLTSFSLVDITDVSYWEDMKKIRDKYKQVSSLLNMTADIPTGQSNKPPLSF